MAKKSDLISLVTNETGVRPSAGQFKEKNSTKHPKTVIKRVTLCVCNLGKCQQVSDVDLLMFEETANKILQDYKNVTPTSHHPDADSDTS